MPGLNVGILLLGSMIANLIGTTSTSMLLIQPYMRLNQGRLMGYYMVFFIFIVNNVGRVLTPIGDPPLFLGFLSSVSFFWTLSSFSNLTPDSLQQLNEISHKIELNLKPFHYKWDQLTV